MLLTELAPTVLMSWFGMSLGLSIVLPQMLELYEQVLPFPISKPVHTQHQGLSVPTSPLSLSTHSSTSLLHSSNSFRLHSIRNITAIEPGILDSMF